ncbi:uncharacterized protein METZ01_LOCUS318577 [marine metagenome]|uniref:Uncharacterized protein n=1 Tax=marine metagenome TaxID=408172 RepID=A0A382NX45_9ZZZZ
MTKTQKEIKRMTLNSSGGRPTSITRKILLWAFVIGFWFFFYWYRGQANKKPSVETTIETTVKTTTPKQQEPVNPKKEP